MGKTGELMFKDTNNWIDYFIFILCCLVLIFCLSDFNCSYNKPSQENIRWESQLAADDFHFLILHQYYDNGGHASGRNGKFMTLCEGVKTKQQIKVPSAPNFPKPCEVWIVHSVELQFKFLGKMP
jgi:hypothetical protein